MEDGYMIKTLWIDDEYEKGTAFMDSAYEFGIDIDPVPCVEDGIDKLRDSSISYDAIILDANCKVSRNTNELASIDALGEAINRLLRMNSNLPWFVYTAANYQGTEHLKSIIKVGGKRSYDDRDFYVKPNYKELLANIKKAVANMPATLVKKKYADVLKVYSSSELIQLLIGLEQGSISKDNNVPNTIRKILEWVMATLNLKGVLPVLFTGTNLAKCSRCLGDMRGFIPSYIQRSVHKCEELSNEGSHGESATNNLIREGKAPYLNMSLVYDLLNIIHWCGTIPDDVEGLRKKSIKSYTSKNKNIIRFGKINKINGILQLDNIIISVADKSLKEGDIVAKVKGAGKGQDEYIKLAYLD